MLLGGLGATLAVDALDWLAVGLHWERLKYATKPIAILAIAAWYVVANLPVLAHPTHSEWPVAAWFTVGLGLSLIGDVLLVLPRERFSGGLITFLLAHIAYIAGLNPFAARPGLPGAALAAVIFLLAGGYFIALLSGLQRRSARRSLIAGATAYFLTATGMLVSAVFTLFQPDWSLGAALVTALGGLLFFCSDGLLAANRFIRPVSHARLIVRILYHLGQIGLAAGVTLHLLGAAG